MGEQGLPVDYSVVTPNAYQTALAGEPGNYFRKAMGDPKKTTIRHIEEAHSAFGKASEDQSGVQRQQRTLVDASNIVLDEIASDRTVRARRRAIHSRGRGLYLQLAESRRAGSGAGGDGHH